MARLRSNDSTSEPLHVVAMALALVAAAVIGSFAGIAWNSLGGEDTAESPLEEELTEND
jgi:hypothetical protein